MKTDTGISRIPLDVRYPRTKYPYAVRTGKAVIRSTLAKD